MKTMTLMKLALYGDLRETEEYKFDYLEHNHVITILMTVAFNGPLEIHKSLTPSQIPGENTVYVFFPLPPPSRESQVESVQGKECPLLVLCII